MFQQKNVLRDETEIKQNFICIKEDNAWVCFRFFSCRFEVQNVDVYTRCPTVITSSMLQLHSSISTIYY